MGDEAQQEYERQTQDRSTMDKEDVLLDVPRLHVDSLDLEVSDLRARVSLQADVLSLLRLNVGIDADLGQVRLDLRGVDAQALLKVRLENVTAILDRVLRTIDSRPEIVEFLVRGTEQALRQTWPSAGQALRQAARGAGPALGQAMQAARQADQIVQDAQEAERAAGHAAAQQVRQEAGQPAGPRGGEAGQQAQGQPSQGQAGQGDQGHPGQGEEGQGEQGQQRGKGEQQPHDAEASATGGRPRAGGDSDDSGRSSDGDGGVTAALGRLGGAGMSAARSALGKPVEMLAERLNESAEALRPGGRPDAKDERS